MWRVFILKGKTMPLHALYNPRRAHKLVTDAKGRLVKSSYAEWCSLVDRLFEDLPLTDLQSSMVH